MDLTGPNYPTSSGSAAIDCPVDNVSIGVAYMWDWLEDALR